MWGTPPPSDMVGGWISGALELAPPDSPARAKALVARCYSDYDKSAEDAAEASRIAERVGEPLCARTDTTYRRSWRSCAAITRRRSNGAAGASRSRVILTIPMRALCTRRREPCGRLRRARRGAAVRAPPARGHRVPLTAPPAARHLRECSSWRSSWETGPRPSRCRTLCNRPWLRIGPRRAFATPAHYSCARSPTPTSETKPNRAGSRSKARRTL